MTPRHRQSAQPDVRMISAARAAERLNVCQETIRRWIRSGRIRFARPGGKRGWYRIPVSEVERLEAM